MAKRPAKPVGTAPVPTTNPHTWLELNPLEGCETPNFMFGVLLKEHGGRTNTATEFTTVKLQPIPPAPGGPLITSERAEVALPHGADDRYLDPFFLAAEVDRAAVTDKPMLLGYVTLYYPHADRLHHAWRDAFGFAQSIADEAKIAVVTALHVPGRQGSSNPVHAHLMLMGPRELTPAGGLGAYRHELAFPRGQKLLFERWRARA